MVQSIPSGATTYSFSIVRAFSKLSHVWVTCKTAAGLQATNFNIPTTPAAALAGSWTQPVLRIDLKNLTADAVTEVHITLWAYAVCSVR